MKLKKIAFIIPYFGKFNNYFEIWLHSCRFNSSIDWLIFTDDHTPYMYPENVKVHYTTFLETKDFIQTKFDFPIVLNNPYQLCEFRIAFGEIYSAYLNDYDFWGFCDTDVIWGNLRNHITDEILDLHTKISWRGHLTLFRNDRHTSSLYKTKIDSIDFYKYLFSNISEFPLASDEREINYIFIQEGEKIYTELIFADLKIRSFNFQLLHFSESLNYKNKSQVFYWENGELYRIYVVEGAVMKENFAYIHFLKRGMKISENFNLDKNILIVPNRFINSSEIPDKDDIVKLSVQKIYWSYFISKISISYLRGKLRYYKSKRIFKNKYSFLPLKLTEIQLPDPISELISK